MKAPDNQEMDRVKGPDTNSENVPDAFSCLVITGIIPGRKAHSCPAPVAGFDRNLSGNVESDFCAVRSRAACSTSTGDAAAAIEESEHDY